MQTKSNKMTVAVPMIHLVQEEEGDETHEETTYRLFADDPSEVF